MVYRILINREYKGDYVGGKCKQAAPCSKKTIRQSEKDCIVIENAHDSIVSKEEFDLANATIIRLAKRKNKRENITYPLKGKVRCGNCTHVMRYF